MKISFDDTMGWLKAGSLALIALGAAAALNRDNPAYAGITPNPYLVVAVILGVTLGAKGALPVCLLIAGAQAVTLYLTADLSKVESVFTLSTALLPLSIVVLPGILGLVRDQFKGETVKLKEEIEQKQSTINDLQLFGDMLNAEKQEFEAKLALQGQTIARAFEYGAKLEVSDYESVGNVILEMIRSELAEENCAIYRREGENLRLVCESGGQGPSEIPKSALEDHPVLAEALNSSEIVESRILPSAAGEQSVGAPMLTEDGRPIGVILVRDIDFVNYLPSTFTTLENIAKWGSLCFARVQRLADLRNKTYQDDVTGLFNHRYFQKRIQSDFRRARSHKTPLSLIRFEVRDFGKLSPHQAYTVTKLFADCVDKPSENADSVVHAASPGSFTAVFMGSDEKEIGDYKKRVLDGFSEINGNLDFADLSLSVYRTDLKDTAKSVEDFLKGETAVQ